MSLTKEALYETEEIIGPILLDILEAEERSIYVTSNELVDKLEEHFDESDHRRAQIVGTTMARTNLGEKYSGGNITTYKINQDYVRREFSQ